MGECKFCNFSLHDTDMFDEETDHSKTIKGDWDFTFHDGTKIGWGLRFKKCYDNDEKHKHYKLSSELCFNSFSVERSIKIKYCPMCGRNLLKETVETND